ncbi:MAG: class I SAM-dependent methyltransferase [Aerococcus sp.]|nr:class I SAM-dependent methyltransferase [Aerococcus sp.]
MATNIVTITHQYIKQWLTPGKITVDATVGQGFDTLYLAEQVGKMGHVYGFDIQPQAIRKTKERLKKAELLDRVTLYQAGHEQLDQYLPSDVQVDLGIFNLGYLPHGDKSIITHPETTVPAVKQLLERLTPGGHVLIAAYIGHPGGLAEYETLITFLSTLDQTQFAVGRFEFINQKHQPPKLILIERRSSHGA